MRVPVATTHDGLIMALHCKTDNSPEEVTLGTVGNCEAIGKIFRPLPFQLKRGETEESYQEKKVNSLVSLNGEQNGPVHVVNYNPESVISVVHNKDSVGSRVEQALLFSVPKPEIKNAKSVFSDGACILVEIKNRKAFVGKWEIPIELTNKWKESDNSKVASAKLNFEIDENIFLNCTVPAAALIEFIRQTKRCEIINLFFNKQLTE